MTGTFSGQNFSERQASPLLQWDLSRVTEDGDDGGSKSCLQREHGHYYIIEMENWTMVDLSGRVTVSLVAPTTKSAHATSFTPAPALAPWSAPTMLKAQCSLINRIFILQLVERLKGMQYGRSPLGNHYELLATAQALLPACALCRNLLGSSEPLLLTCNRSIT